MNGKRLPIHAKGKSNTPQCSTVESMWTMKESGSCPGARLRMINLFSHMSPWSPPSRSRRQRKLQIPTSASSSSCPTACAGRRSSVAPTPRCSRRRITTTIAVLPASSTSTSPTRQSSDAGSSCPFSGQPSSPGDRFWAIAMPAPKTRSPTAPTFLPRLQRGPTLAAVLGRNWDAAEPNAGKPLSDLISSAQQAAVAH